MNKLDSAIVENKGRWAPGVWTFPEPLDGVESGLRPNGHESCLPLTSADLGSPVRSSVNRE